MEEYLVRKLGITAGRKLPTVTVRNYRRVSPASSYIRQGFARASPSSTFRAASCAEAMPTAPSSAGESARTR